VELVKRVKGQRKSYDFGPNNAAWKGDDAVYNSLHSRVYRKLGKASNYICVDCDGNAEQWSQINGTPGTAVDNYDPRCTRCHCKYDGRNVGERNGYSKLTKSDIVEIREKYRTTKYSQSDLAYIYGVNQPTISKIVNNKSWN
jgi:DNA-binding XRE family transcriptional regulator